MWGAFTPVRDSELVKDRGKKDGCILELQLQTLPKSQEKKKKNHSSLLSRKTKRKTEGR